MKVSFDDVILSETVFYFNTLDKTDDEGNTILHGGRTYGKKGVDGICVDFASESEESLVHEMRHASGYLNHEWDLDMSDVDEHGRYSLINYDYQDEYEAYYIENQYGFYYKNRRLKFEGEIKKEIRNDYNSGGPIPIFEQFTRDNPYNPINK